MRGFRLSPSDAKKLSSAQTKIWNCLTRFVLCHRLGKTVRGWDIFNVSGANSFAVLRPARRSEKILARITPVAGSQKACSSRAAPFDCFMFSYTALTKDRQWHAGPYDGVELLTLHKNEATGGITVLRKFRAGTTVPAHVHPHANESVYVLSGEWEESGVTYGTGAFFFAPKGAAHGPHVAKTEVVSLTIFDGPLSVQPAA